MSKNISRLESDFLNLKSEMKSTYQKRIYDLNQEIAKLMQDAAKCGIELNNDSVIPDFKRLFAVYGMKFNKGGCTHFIAKLLAEGIVVPELEYGSYKIKYAALLPHVKSYKHLADAWMSMASSLNVIQRRYKLRWEKCTGGYIIA